MDDNKQYVVALEISSSKIVGVLGVPNSNGGVEVLDIEAERSPNCVRYGCIQNVEETKVRINRVLTRLEARISPKKITGVYVGINGRSVHNHSMSISASFDEERMITENVVESLKKRFASEAPPRYHHAGNWGFIRNEQLLAMLDNRLAQRNTFQGELFGK